MELFKIRLITTLVAFMLLIGAALGGILFYVFPQWYPNWYIQTLGFFLLLEIVVLYYAAASSEKSTDKQMLNVYMLTKVIKIFASLAFVAIYAFAVKSGLKSFVLVFMLLYLLFLAVEGYLFVKIEKRLKEKQKKHEILE